MSYRVNRCNTRWSVADVDRILSMRRAKYSSEQIAIAFSRERLPVEKAEIRKVLEEARHVRPVAVMRIAT